jgi:hypothetical protein
MSDLRNFDLRSLPDGGNLDDQDLLYVQRPWSGEANQNPNARRVYASAVQRTKKDSYNNTVTVEDGYWEDLRFPAQGINPAGSPAPASVDSSTYFGTLLFAGNTDNHIAGVAQLPHSWQRGTAIRPHIHWAKTTTASGDIAWRFRYAWADIGGTFSTYSDWQSPATGGVSHSNTANKHALTSFPEMSPATGVGESSIILWELMRDVSEDDVADAVRLFELDFHYQTNKSGTRSEVPED